MQHYFLEKKDNNFYLLDSDIHHIKNVMRMKNHDHIIGVYDGKQYECEILFNESNVQIKILNQLDKNTKLSKKVILYQAVIKNDKFDLVVQKACELGADILVPTIFKYSVVKVDGKENSKLQRYEKIIKEACEQSQRTTKMEVGEFVNVKDIKIDSKTLALLAYEKEDDKTSLKRILSSIEDYDTIVLLVGPEGGISKDEVAYLSSIGFKSISLGKRILRSETASLYGLSVISYMLEGE